MQELDRRSSCHVWVQIVAVYNAHDLTTLCICTLAGAVHYHVISCSGQISREILASIDRSLGAHIESYTQTVSAAWLSVSRTPSDATQCRSCVGDEKTKTRNQWASVASSYSSCIVVLLGHASARPGPCSRHRTHATVRHALSQTPCCMSPAGHPPIDHHASRAVLRHRPRGVRRRCSRRRPRRLDSARRRRVAGRAGSRCLGRVCSTGLLPLRHLSGLRAPVRRRRRTAGTGLMHRSGRAVARHVRGCALLARHLHGRPHGAVRRGAAGIHLSLRIDIRRHHAPGHWRIERLALCIELLAIRALPGSGVECLAVLLSRRVSKGAGQM